MESPVEDFDVLNVIPLFLGLTDISLVSPMLVFLIILFIFVIVYYYLIGEPALSDNPQGFLVSWWQEYFNELTEEDYYLGFRIAPVMWMVGQIMICSVTIMAVSNGAETPIALLIVMLPWSLIFWVTFVFITLGLSDKYVFATFEPIVPNWLLPLLLVVELSSYVLRLFSLAIRVAANFTSGHILFFTLLTALASAYQILSFGGWFFMWPALVVVELLESAVVFIQTQVFLSLLLVYISESLASTIFLSTPDYQNMEVDNLDQTQIHLLF